jgi:hypothetical protein
MDLINTGQDEVYNNGVVEEEAEELAEDEQVKLMPFPFIYNIGGSVGDE